MTKRQVKYLASITAVMVTGLGAAPHPHESKHVVHPGQSIQKAVNKARPGDTIVILPGTFRESVRITKSNLTLRGSGADTVIKPAAGRTKNSCAQAGNGICVTGTADHVVRKVSIRSLTVSGFKNNAIWATGTDRLGVYGVTAEKSGKWGIAQQKSTRGVFNYNTARNNAETGIFIANTTEREGGSLDTKGAVIRGNTLSGNRIGVTIRRSRNLTIENNTVTGNCGGIFVVGDESKPRAGALSVVYNEVSKNNKYCAGNTRLPFIQGSGIVLTGAEDTLVRGNLVRDNVGKSPLSGGIVLFKSFVGALNERNTITFNVSLRNSPADQVNGDTGKGNKFRSNVCRSSKPAGLC
ncbi:right-handed parallel beta-helix repeat-containing protein [Streptomyces sp. NPDC004647]|uniref:right-handed parallel beta-helix repeat-containing protein n=1 Tax=Streptomyces sp. NPDC004647 TaxID=3154671 RepID=UPI00339E156C